jgi:hypothetical protein
MTTNTLVAKSWWFSDTIGELFLGDNKLQLISFPPYQPQHPIDKRQGMHRITRYIQINRMGIEEGTV